MSLLIKVLPVKKTDTFIDYKLYSISLFISYSLSDRELHVYRQNKVTFNFFKITTALKHLIKTHTR